MTGYALHPEAYIDLDEIREFISKPTTALTPQDE